MIEWMRFAIIVLIAATAHVLYELVLSFNTTRDFVWYRLRWIVRDKLRATLRRRWR
jgi:hypothetical protein